MTESDIVISLPTSVRPGVGDPFWRLIDQVIESPALGPDVIREKLQIPADTSHVLVTMLFKGREATTNKLTNYVKHLNNPIRLKERGPCLGYFLREVPHMMTCHKTNESISKMEDLWQKQDDAFACQAMSTLTSTKGGILWFFELVETDDPDADAKRYYKRAEFKPQAKTEAKKPAAISDDEKQLRENLSKAGYSPEMIEAMKMMAMAKIAVMKASKTSTTLKMS